MKSLLAVFFLFSAMLTKQPEYISIKHIGEIDKPIFPIVISKEKVVITGTDRFTSYTDRFTSYFIVKSEEYYTLKSIILVNGRFDNIPYNVDPIPYEFGSFKITVRDATQKDLCCYLNRRKSNQLVDQLIKILKEQHGDTELLTELEVLKRRIRLNYY